MRMCLTFTRCLKRRAWTAYLIANGDNAVIMQTQTQTQKQKQTKKKKKIFLRRLWRRSRQTAAFTLIELLVVMAIISLLLTLVMPRYFNNVEKTKEVVLRQNLSTLRDAIDQHFSDLGIYPETLDELVEKKYLRQIAIDPLTERADTWIIQAPEASDIGAVADIRSGAPGKARDGSEYKDW